MVPLADLEVFRCDPPPDPNADLLAQLQSTAILSGPDSNAELLAQLNPEPEPNPVASVEHTGDLATDTGAELDALAVGFHERTKHKDERFRLNADPRYRFAPCFKSREEKDAFLTSSRLLHIGDTYLHGRATAAGEVRHHHRRWP